jgi:DNA-binding XRE family transcriptional regulator
MDIEKSVNLEGEKKLLRDVRNELKLTQIQLANYLGIEQASLSKLENGKKIPDWLLKAIRLNKILKDAGYTLDDIKLPTSSNEQ